MWFWRYPLSNCLATKVKWGFEVIDHVFLSFMTSYKVRKWPASPGRHKLQKNVIYHSYRRVGTMLGGGGGLSGNCIYFFCPPSPYPCLNFSVHPAFVVGKRSAPCLEPLTPWFYLNWWQEECCPKDWKNYLIHVAQLSVTLDGKKYCRNPGDRKVI